MISRLALALTIAAASTGAAAQSNRPLSYHDLTKPYEAKTNPAIPLAPPAPAVSAPPIPTIPIEPPETSPSTDNPALLDRCDYLARRKLPLVMEGAQVASTTREFITPKEYTPGWEYWTILVRVDFNGKGIVGYRSICRVWKHGAELIH